MNDQENTKVAQLPESVIYPDEYELIGSKNSYFSAKVRACLQYKRLPYVEVTANIESIMRAKQLTGSHIYPVVMCPDGSVLRDSCDIVVALEQRHPVRPVIPEDPLLHLVALITELIADCFILEGAMTTRWCHDRNADWAKRLFSQVSSERVKNDDLRQRGIENGTRIGASIRKRFVAMNDTDYDPHWHIEATRDILSRLDRHLTTTPFLLGDRPSLADLGMLNAMYGHLYRDPGELSDYMHWECISLSLWTEHMLAAAGESDRGPLYLTASMERVLAGFGQWYGERALNQVREADQRLRGLPDGEIVGIAAAPNYAAWRCQRLRDCYLQLDKECMTEANRLLDLAGLLEVCQFQANWRAEKQDLELIKVPNR
jgi:glutathione S-transferase